MLGTGVLTRYVLGVLPCKFLGRSHVRQWGDHMLGAYSLLSIVEMTSIFFRKLRCYVYLKVALVLSSIRKSQ